MRNFLLCSSILFASSFSFSQAHAQCFDILNCQSMGYTKTSCINGGVKCPTGNLWYCPKDCEDGEQWVDGKCQKPTIAWGSCSGLAKNCAIGNILNSDGTCSYIKLSGKTPIGIVIFKSGDCGFALALEDAASSVQWSSKLYVTPPLTGGTNDAVLSCENTGRIIETGTFFPAAYAAYNYAPKGAEETKGKWCLPTSGLMGWAATGSNFSAFYRAFVKNGFSLPAAEYWTSSHPTTGNGYIPTWMIPNDYTIYRNEKKRTSYLPVRAVIQF